MTVISFNLLVKKNYITLFEFCVERLEDELYMNEK